MAIDANSKTKLFEPIVIEIDGKTVEICSCGQTSHQDRTCDESHEILNAEIKRKAKKKGITVEEVLNKLNEEQMNGHMCACGGNCGCGDH